MNLSETNESLSQIKVPEKDKKALLKLIDIKIENDMKEVITEIKSLKNEIKIIYWVIGIAMAIIITLLSILKI